MLASTCHFANNTSNTLAPIYDFVASEIGNPELKFDAGWELAAGLGSLPLRVVFYNPGGYYHANTNKQLVFKPYLPPFRNGFTDAVCSVVGTINVEGSSFPAGFVFEQYAPGAPTKYDLWVRRRIDVKMTSVRVVCSEDSFIPTPKGRVIVNDWRLSRASPPLGVFSYLNPRRSWISALDARKFAPSERNRRRISPFAMMVFIFLLALPLLISLWRKMLRTSRDKAGERRFMTGR